MKYSADYTWYAAYINTDMLWLDDSLNWDNAFELLASEYSLVDALATSFFLSAHYFIDWLVKLSGLDIIVLWGENNQLPIADFFLLLVRDYADNFSNLSFSIPFLFYADYQDWIATVLYYSPELIFALHDFIAYLIGDIMALKLPSSLFDSYQDSTGLNNAEFLDYLGSFLPFLVYTLLILTSTRLVTVTNTNDAYPLRGLFYLSSVSTETRFQFESGVQTVFFLIMYISMMTTTFDDDQEELLEFFNCMCYYFFLFTLFYYFYKYSIHYFSFLEAGKNDSKSISLISQAVFDGFNIVGFTARFLVLMIRLNIYDGIDDILDSYYIFVADFEEEEYLIDSFFSLFSTLSFDTDVHDDRSFLFEDETDFPTDLFSIYFIIWGKFAYFWLFILEEIARVSLAFYVTYLLMFEINAVNRAYLEDSYLSFKRDGSKLPTGVNFI